MIGTSKGFLVFLFVMDSRRPNELKRTRARTVTIGNTALLCPPASEESLFAEEAAQERESCASLYSDAVFVRNWKNISLIRLTWRRCSSSE